MFSNNPFMTKDHKAQKLVVLILIPIIGIVVFQALNFNEKSNFLEKELHDLHDHEGHREARFHQDTEIARSDLIFPEIPRVMEAFEDWMEIYVLAEPNEKDRLLNEGVHLARNRRLELKQLIQSDPEAALAWSIPYKIRQSLPIDVVDQLEKLVSEFGRFELLVYCPEPGQSGGGFERLAEIDDKTYQVFTHGHRVEVSSKDALSFHGIAIDDVLAMGDDPVRVLSDLEKSDRYINADQVAAVGTILFEFEDQAALGRLRAMVQEDERTLGPRPKVNYSALSSSDLEGISVLYSEDTNFGGGDFSEMQSEHTEGPKRMLYMRARFSNQDSDFEPNDLATLMQRQAGCEAYWFENSYGKSSLTTVFADTVSLPESASFYADQTSGRLNTLYNAVIPLVIAAGQAKGEDWDPDNYDFFTLLSTGGSWGYAGVASVGGRRSHLNGAGSSNIRTASHEFGHNLGLRHANYWRTDSTSPIGRDSIPGGYSPDGVGDERIEYGHKFSVMGGQNGGGDFNEGRGHYTTGEKVRMDWLVAGDGDWVSVSVSTPNPIRLYRHDVESENFGSMTTGVARAIKINRDSGDYALTNKRRYWLSYRRLPKNGISEDWLPYGLLVDWQRENYGNDGSILLDMTPYSRDDENPNQASRRDNNDKEDAVVVVGRTYSDITADIHFTPISQGGENPNEWIDVIVNIGTQRENKRPQIESFTASTVVIGTNDPINFEVAATDPDGDPLFHSWTFGDNAMVLESLNATTATKSWIQTGLYPVRVTVSDGKGGSDTREILINVGGALADNTISGRVIQGGLPVEGVRVIVDAVGASAWTDGNGIYVLPGLSNGLNLVEVAKGDLRFNPLFSNPVSLFGDDLTGLDWLAQEDGFGNGSLRIVITPFSSNVPVGAELAFKAWGWDESGKLIPVSPAWSVSGGGTISKDGIYLATEEGGPYAITATQGSSVAQAEVIVSDIEAVGIVALTPEVSEPGLEDGRFQVRRYGDSTEEMIVNIVSQGSATEVKDYASYPTQVNFENGQEIADVVIDILDDFEVESKETIILTLVSDDDYDIYSIEASATIELLDDSDKAPEITIISPKQPLSVIPIIPGSDLTSLLIEVEVTDDGLPNPPGNVSVNYAVAEAPDGGAAIFSPPQAFSTSASFSKFGLYKVLISVHDGVNTSTEELDVSVVVDRDEDPYRSGRFIYYSFDQAEGMEVTNSIDNRLDGSLVGDAAWTLPDGGVKNSGVMLNGIDGQVRIPNSPNINLQDHSQRTIAFWFQADDPFKPGKQVLYEEGGGTRGLNIFLEGGMLFVGGWNNGANSWEKTYLKTPLIDGDWHHVGLVLNAQVSTDLQPDALKGYLDGLEFGSGGAATLDPHSGGIGIGSVNGATQFHDGNSGGESFPFSGKIDEFYLWNVSLLPGQMAHLSYDFYFGPLLFVASNVSGAVLPNGMGAYLRAAALPDPNLVTHWEIIESPDDANVSIFDAEALSTLVRFPDPGFYKLRLTGDDGIQVSAIDVNIHAGIDEGTNFFHPSESIYYSFDEGQSTTVGNSISANYDAELVSGASWRNADNSISGSSIYLDGIDDLIRFPEGSPLEESATQKSISFWFKSDFIEPGELEVLFELGDEGTGMIVYLESGVIHFGAWDNLIENPWSTRIAVPNNLREWRHVVIVLNVKNSESIEPGALKIYLDGVLVGVGSAGEFRGAGGESGLGGINGGTFLEEGEIDSDGNMYFMGQIDEFHFYQGHSLTIGQIGMLYAFGNIAPIVDAGPDQLDLTSLNVSLDGSSTDDGRWIPLYYEWGFVDRPGAGVFSVPNQQGMDTLLQLHLGGTYRIFLATEDGRIGTYDEFTVKIDKPGYFDLWLDGYPSITGEDRNPDANPDNDNRNNLAEYGFGGIPDTIEGSFAFDLETELIELGGELFAEFRFPRRIDRALRGLYYHFQVSDNLSSESWTEPAYSIVSVESIDEDFEEVRLQLVESLSSEDLKIFGRVLLETSD
ncbi:MAG: hypothetical protein CMI18_14125 [Opitutaceae bacterium]|nr:hypothetical protein [Opitutaceae bacterium]